MTRFSVWIVVGALALALVAPAAAAQEEAGRWAFGGYFGLNQPVFGLSDWYDGTAKVGISFAYVASSRISVEFEYLRARDGSGSLEDREFTWFIDNKNYRSPDVSATMTWNNVAMNGIIRLVDRPFLVAEAWFPYLTVGLGYFKYHSRIENLVWPGQADLVTGASSLNPNGPGPDGTLVFPPYDDRRAALSFSIGGGLEAFVTKNISLDVRARYHLSIGELRPINAYGLSQTFPLQQFDVGGGVKFYFQPF